MNNSGVSGVSGAVGGDGFLKDEKLEKVGLRLKNIFHDNYIKSYYVCDNNNVYKKISQQQYDALYLQYIRKEKLKNINNK